jgi:hypothetical protein
VAQPPRALRAGVLLVEDDLLVEARAATAVLLGPADAGPARLPELLLPGLALVDEGVLVADAAAPTHQRELAAQGVGEPRRDLTAEGLVCFAEMQIHGGLVSRALLDG